MKIVTYNVNGLRQRVAQHGSLRSLLASLDADIICFQETKLSRQDLSVDLTMAEGYEAFVSCTRTSDRGRSGYSGVATFCRVSSAFSSNEVALPLAAEEGFTGLLERSRKVEITRDFLLEASQEVEGLKDITNEDLLKVDSEGRCIITDHGHFVLFNIYGPRAVDDDEERLHFKLVFFKTLQKRLESLLSQGKRVFVVGDLNIAPACIDRCDAEPGFEKNVFRKWLRSLLRECGGPFFDVFRSKHPERKEAYTCFSPRIGAEEFNYGSRIDHILIAGSCFHQNHDSEGHNIFDCHVEECDIMSRFKRGNSDNAPKWKGGRSIKLEGSDHIPVVAILNDVPALPLHNTPSLAVRYIPEVRGWQQSIVSFLTKGQASNSKCQSLSTSLSVENTAAENCNKCVVSSQDGGTISKTEMAGDESRVSSGQNLPNPESDGQSLNPSVNEDLNIVVNDTKNTTLKMETEKTKSPSHCSFIVKKARLSSSSQLTIKSFFQQPKTVTSVDKECVRVNTSSTPANIGIDRHDLSDITEQSSDQNFSHNNEESSCKIDENSVNPHVQDLGDTCPLKSEKDNAAILEWQRIQQQMKISLPLCKGHGEPCVARSVKKVGPNSGRQFYVCARAQGPASNPEANCGFFQWASAKAKGKRRRDGTVSSQLWDAIPFQ